MPENIFDKTVHSPTEMKQALLYYALWMRTNRTGNTKDQFGKPMQLLSTTISNIISAFTHMLGELDPDLIPLLHRDRLQPNVLTKTLKGMNRFDNVMRGHHDRFCKIPAGIEFVEQLLAWIAAYYQNEPAMLSLYSILALFEYMFGGRTFECCVKTGVVHLPDCVPINDGDTDYHPSFVDMERTASIHSVRYEDVQFMWPDGTTLFAYDVHGLAAKTGFPDAIYLYGTQKNNQYGTHHPSCIVVNPQLEGCSSLCLVTMMYRWILRTKPNTSRDFVFRGAHDHQFTEFIKNTADMVGLPRHRMHATSLRIGCESATTPELLDMTEQQARLLVQHHQHWLRPDGSKPYHISQLRPGVVKTAQLLRWKTTSISDTKSRFNRFDQASIPTFHPSPNNVR